MRVGLARVLHCFLDKGGLGAWRDASVVPFENLCRAEAKVEVSDSWREKQGPRRAHGIAALVPRLSFRFEATGQLTSIIMRELAI